MFFQSIGNKFILKRKDAFFIDGNDRYLSAYIYKSCASRDSACFGIPICDVSWLDYYDPHSHDDDDDDDKNAAVDRFANLNPLALGHYINSSVKNATTLPQKQIHRHRGSAMITTANNVEPNVMYYECDFDLSAMPSHLLRFIPNVHYSSDGNQNGRSGDAASSMLPLKVKSIVMVSLREICDGEELFASYFSTTPPAPTHTSS
eukprot:GEZU01011471.1.p1 GENE.GEZU01011471.1~~GEZU01011471.1.p1  ORF type:complete len:204 (+),score=37.99 GEZU01011471.1:296-907(+)